MPALSNDTAQFNASKHLCYEEPSKRYTLTEFGVDPASKDALSDFSFCEPFPLLTPEGVQVQPPSFYDELLHFLK